MRKTTTIFAFLVLVTALHAQVSFKTIVPQQPVVAGESFQVQYVIEDGDRTISVKPPVFSNFRFVAGPNIYMGSVSTVNGVKPLRNTVYTLEAVRPGRFMIPGAAITVDGKTVRSNNAIVEVISKEEAVKKFNRDNGLNNSDYFLRPGENAYEKIRQNLFVKVLVDKKSCYVGEPVLATFKLYSRLESKSDIIKNPGFYGFTVYDMVNLTDKQVTTENVNGKTFDVHTIRKVQLYPLQEGLFTIDAMQVKNKVEFSRSAVNKKTEQEIVEGVLGSGDDEIPTEGTEVFETDITTEPVAITVRPLPEKNRPGSFSGATGHFSITAAVINDRLAKNEQGFFEITITGKGNFIQLDAPTVLWPSEIEGFEPTVKDVFDKTKMPLSGSRRFRYPFVCASPGKWQLPPVSFSFFDTDSNNYRTISTKNVNVVVSNEIKKELLTGEPKASIAEKSEKAARAAGIIVVVLVLLILLYWAFKKKEPEKIMLQQQPALPSVESLLEPAHAALETNGNEFYSTLHSIIWKFAREQFGLSGSEMNKQQLAAKMNGAGADTELSENLFQILEECEARMFTNASLLYNRQSMLATTKQILENIRPISF
ncbi:MAG: BatD family protein [Chitinophagaceae bacterium]